MGRGALIGTAIVVACALAGVGTFFVSVRSGPPPANDVAPPDDDGVRDGTTATRRHSSESARRSAAAPAAAAAADTVPAPEDVTDAPIEIEGLSAAEIERTRELMLSFAIGGPVAAKAMRDMLTFLREFEGDRRAFVELALALEGAGERDSAAVLLAALGRVVDDALTLRLLESVDEFSDRRLRVSALLSIGYDRRELGPPPGDRAEWSPVCEWVQLSGGVHEADVRRLLIEKTRRWLQPTTPVDESLAVEALQLLRFSVTYPDVRTVLIEALDSDRDDVVPGAISALGSHRYGADVHDALVAVATSDRELPYGSRQRALGALVRMGGSDGVEFVLTRLEAGKEPSSHLLLALQGIGTAEMTPAIRERARQALLRGLDTSAPDVQEIAATVLVWGTHPYAQLRTSDLLPRVFALLRDPARDPSVRTRVLGQMAEYEATLEVGFTTFAEIARDETATLDVRLAALDMLSRLATSKAAHALDAEDVIRELAETSTTAAVKADARQRLEKVRGSRE